MIRGAAKVLMSALTVKSFKFLGRLTAEHLEANH